jgi:hypothetical protein
MARNTRAKISRVSSTRGSALWPKTIATLGIGWKYVRIDDASRVAFVQVMATQEKRPLSHS